MDIKEQIHVLSEEMIENLGKLVAVDSQLGTPEEGKPFGEGPAEVLSVGLKIAEELGFHTVNLDNYCGYAEMGEVEFPTPFAFGLSFTTCPSSMPFA